MASGDVNAGRDIYTGIVNTGVITDQRTINLIIADLDQAVLLLAQTGCALHRDETGQITLAAGEQTLALPVAMLQAFSLAARSTALPHAARHRAYAFWLATRQPARPEQLRHARDHYVPLSGWLSAEEEIIAHRFSEVRVVGDGPQRQLQREPLPDVTEAVRRHPAFVLLGPPGSGKSTVLHRLALDTARQFLAAKEDDPWRLPLWLDLADYRDHDPLQFVRERWAGLVADDLVELVRRGRILLLLDGLNEMSRLDDPARRAERIEGWVRFLNTYFSDEADPHASRVVIASRDGSDYNQRLGLPQVEIERLDDDQTARFIEAYRPGQVEALRAAITQVGLSEQAQRPYHLYVLTQLYDPTAGGLPASPGQLFARYAERLLRLMYPPTASLELTAGLAALAELGYALQQRGESTRLPVEQVKSLLPGQVAVPGQPQPVPTSPEDLFHRAVRAGLLLRFDEPPAPSCKFSHQLLQEQFAAQHLLARWQAGVDVSSAWRVARTPAEMPPPQVGEWDPLPPPPPTGWEQSTILAAGIINPPDRFVGAVLAVNPALAGRCLSEGRAEVSPDTRAAVQQALLVDLGDPALHRRARIEAGRVLAAMGDPRLQPVRLNQVTLILPDLVKVPGGTATLGSRRWPFDRQAFNDERPRHQVQVATFYLGRWPVTNAEYRCFIEAGGYDEERYWPPAGWQWRQGKAETSGPVEDWLGFRRTVLENPTLIDQYLKEGRWMPETADTWRYLIRLSEDEARQVLAQAFPLQSHTQPAYWDDPAYNQANQPVVGVTWYEAVAYCAWLTEQVGAGGQGSGVGDWPAKSGSEGVSGGLGEAWAEIRAKLVTGQSSLVIRLPSEAEWEWAAGGPSHRRYPWGGEFDPDKANTLEGRVLGTTPVGAYPAGAAESGALDLAGNVYEWTGSLYRPYPYLKEDSREVVEAEGKRVVRGGSWNFSQRYARVSSRSNQLPDLFLYNGSFRVVVAPV
jgi:formylglycine-generating enzyme required for sulfatase activity